MAVPEAFLGTDEPVAVYDFALAVCELAYGDYYDWPLEERNGFDLLMVEAGQLPYCFNLLPNADEISREEAFALAASAVKERYGLGLRFGSERRFRVLCRGGIRQRAGNVAVWH